jgi:hypothetical protein
LFGGNEEDSIARLRFRQAELVDEEVGGARQVLPPDGVDQVLFAVA